MASPTNTTSVRRVPPPCWTHDETLSLVRAYRERRLALGRAQLSSADWAAVAGGASLSKTPTQCRHKVEKLRRRLRSQRRRPCPLLDAIDLLDVPSPSPSLSPSPSPPPLSPPPPPPQPKKRRRVDAGEGDLVEALKAIGEGFLRTEQRRMEAAREAQQMRMEMELRWARMILDAQRRLVDALVGSIVAASE